MWRGLEKISASLAIRCVRADSSLVFWHSRRPIGRPNLAIAQGHGRNSCGPSCLDKIIHRVFQIIHPRLFGSRSWSSRMIRHPDTCAFRYMAHAHRQDPRPLHFKLHPKLFTSSSDYEYRSPRRAIASMRASEIIIENLNWTPRTRPSPTSQNPIGQRRWRATTGAQNFRLARAIGRVPSAVISIGRIRSFVKIAMRGSHRASVLPPLRRRRRSRSSRSRLPHPL